ncbi:MAG: small basic protein [Planctomycetota bacterium]
MTMDRTLRASGGLLRQRNVLTRAERIKYLTDEERFDPEDDSPFGLPKVMVRKPKAGGKKKAKEEVEEAAEGEAPAAG